MNTTNPTQLVLISIFAAVGSLKMKKETPWIGNGLMIIALGLFVYAIIIYIKRQLWLRKK